MTDLLRALPRQELLQKLLDGRESVKTQSANGSLRIVEIQDTMQMHMRGK
jgi:hypothetical protein